MTPATMRLEYGWRVVGKVRVTASGRLAFPNVEPTPAVYKFSAESSQYREAYVGETQDLAERTGRHYRYSTTGRTSVRVRGWLLNALANSRTVELHVMEMPQILSGGSAAAADLSDKSVRRLFESAALFAASTAGERLQNK